MRLEVYGSFDAVPDAVLRRKTGIEIKLLGSLESPIVMIDGSAGQMQLPAKHLKDPIDI